MPHRSQIDVATGLSTRLHAQRYIRGLIDSGGSSRSGIAAIVFDFPDLPKLRAALGVHAADAFLRQVARRICRHAGSHTLLARAGSDSLLIVVEHENLAATATAARRLAAEAIRVGKSSVQLALRPAIGIALWPAHARTAAELGRCAEIAAADAERQHVGLAVYELARDRECRQNLALVAELQRGVARDELILFYQPRVHMGDRSVHSVEALVRWQHPRLGLIGPGRFVPVVEQAGTIGLITDWVLRKALLQLRAWHEQGLSIGVSVNISAHDFADETFPERVLRYMEEYGVGAGGLVLEITETVVMRELARAIAVMNRLRAHGVAFSIDDFGTGYSCLAQLKNLPIDEIKVDGSFVADLRAGSQDDAIVCTIVTLAHSLSLRVVAEGVQTSAHWRRLVSHGCDMAQGYFISAPLPGSEIHDWVTRANSYLSAAASPTAQVRVLEEYIQRRAHREAQSCGDPAEAAVPANALIS